MENLEVPHRLKRGKSPPPRVVRKRSELSVKVCFVFHADLLYFQSYSNQTWNLVKMTLKDLIIQNCCHKTSALIGCAVVLTCCIFPCFIF